MFEVVTGRLRLNDHSEGSIVINSHGPDTPEYQGYPLEFILNWKVLNFVHENDVAENPFYIRANIVIYLFPVVTPFQVSMC